MLKNLGLQGKSCFHNLKRTINSPELVGNKYYYYYGFDVVDCCIVEILDADPLNKRFHCSYTNGGEDVPQGSGEGSWDMKGFFKMCDEGRCKPLSVDIHAKLLLRYNFDCNEDYNRQQQIHGVGGSTRRS